METRNSGLLFYKGAFHQLLVSLVSIITSTNNYEIMSNLHNMPSLLFLLAFQQSASHTCKSSARSKHGSVQIGLTDGTATSVEALCRYATRSRYATHS